MEVAVSLFTPVLRVIQAVHDMTSEDGGIGSRLKIGVRSLRDEMQAIQSDIEEYEEQTLQELAYEIEDFMHGLTTPGAFGFVLTVLGRNPGDGIVDKVEYFKKRLERLEKRLERQRGEASARGTTTVASTGSSSIKLVGRAKSEFEELLSGVDKARLGVISIVGCRGLGKTALAWAVYTETSVVPVPGGFDCKVWVVASEYKDNLQGLLNNILQEIVKGSEASGSSSMVKRPAVTATHDTIRTELQNKKYLVVIDDMLDKLLWDQLEYAFPDTAGSIIVVTTSIQPIATYVGRHRYTMPYLDDESSRNLLHQTMGTPHRGPIVDEDMILRKCDGIPLTLVSVATHLRCNLGGLKRHTDVAQTLGTHIADDKFFEDLKRTLIECYDSLPGYQERRCLLSISMFPQGHQIKMKSLLRKWIAEGLVAAQGQRQAMGMAYKSSKEILERSIIDPVLIGNSSDVKRCQVNGTMLEFIVYNSTCATNFATLIHPRPIGRIPTAKGDSAIRRLLVCDGGNVEEDAAKIRWLTLCPNACFDLSKCSLVRVLDLESCKWIDRKVLQNICKLVLVKYLSLRGTDVSEMPEEIKSLVNLETLDIRDTKVNVLPIEVAMMPGLVHLFGKFELVPDWPGSTIKKSARVVKRKLTKKEKPPSKLETLAGVIIDNYENCFTQIMLHSKNLRKVKISCNKTAAAELIPLEKFCGEGFLKSLSVDCSKPIRLLSVEFLESLSGSCTIESLKLRGKLEGLTNNFIKLQNVIELQLSSTGCNWDDLSVLQEMDGLVYLKLEEDHHDPVYGSFIVEEDGFQGLQSLCIQAPMLPQVQFKKGAMPCLTTLQLLQTRKATPEVTTPQPEASLQVRVTSEMSSSQPEALPHTEATPQVTTQSEAPLHTTMEIITHQMEIISLPETPLQPGEISEITTPQPVLTAKIEPDLGVEGLSHLEDLKEVILHHSVPDATVSDWKNAAKKHVNRPHVKKQIFIATKEAKNKAA